MTVTLVLDSSLSGVSIALLKGTESSPSWMSIKPEHMGSARTIGLEFLAGLGKIGSGLKPSDVSKVIVSTGPGSFTGIKVGLAFLYGLNASQSHLRFKSISSLSLAQKELASSGVIGRDTALFVRATRTHGYGYFPDKPNDDQLTLVNLEDSKVSGSLPPLVSMGPWESLENLAKKSEVPIEVLSPEQVCESAIYGMCKEANSGADAEFQNHLPVPNYMRLSTAEEQLGREVKGENLGVSCEKT